MKKYLFFLLLIVLIPINTLANNNINIYVFHRHDCMHCKNALAYLDELKSDNDNITIFEYELAKETNAHNRNLYIKAQEALEISVGSVPLVIIGNNYYVGFSNVYKEKYLKAIDFYSKNNYKDIVGISLGIVKDNGYENIKYEEKEYKLDIPFFGHLNLKNLSLPIITIIMGLVDGFNPCAMWILLFLITMLFNIKDKRKMWILGLTFIITSAFIYFLFMMAWLRVTSFINSIKLLQIIVGLFAITFAGINLYRYYKERKSNGCTIIKKEKRKLIFSNIKKIVENKYFILSILGIIVLAIIVNLIELLCSLGLPVMFTEILSLNNLTRNKYLAYIILYIFFFMLDDIIVFTISMLSLQSKAISTKYNKYSHLIGGLIMLIIGILMIFAPNLLSFSLN